MSASNKNLKQARAEKNDEFYTLYETVNEECQYYTEHFKNAVVFCNCDNPAAGSQFWEYFHTNFEAFGLKKLISTYYEKGGSPSYKMEYEGGDDLNTNAGVRTPLKGNGDFRSDECVELLEESTLVCTNPPFSLFREYIALLMKYDKKFLVLGNINAIIYKEIFPFIKDNKIWTGFTFNKTVEFIIPDEYDLKGKAYIDKHGKKHGFVPGIVWYTNLDVQKRHERFFKPEEVHAYYEGNEDKYPKIFNTDYDIIEVNKTNMIPIDWNSLMSVPVSYLDKHNAQDFSIVGYSGDRKFAKRMRELAPKGSYAQGGPAFHIVDPTNAARYKCLFSRIVIKNLHPVAKKDDI